MRENSISISQLAKAIFVSPTAVSNWLKGNTFPRPGTLALTAHYLGLNIDFKGSVQKATTNASISMEDRIDQATDELRAEIGGRLGIAKERIKIAIQIL